MFEWLIVFLTEFENSETLLNSEVHMLLEHRKQQNESAEDEQELSEVFMKTLNYTARFSRFKNRETIASVRRSEAYCSLCVTVSGVIRSNVKVQTMCHWLVMVLDSDAQTLICASIH